MSPGPLRRLSGALGLAMLAPIAWLLASGGLTLTEAAFRATVVLVAVLVSGRVVRWFVEGLALTVRPVQRGQEPDVDPARNRRASDGRSEQSGSHQAERRG